MRPRIRVAAAIVWVFLYSLAYVGIVLANAASEAELTPYDCGFLLVMYNNVLNSLIHGDPNISLIKTMYNVTVPKEIERLHRMVYTALQDISEVINLISKASSDFPHEYPVVLAMLYRSMERLMKISNRYVDMLAGCTADRTLATIMSIQISEFNRNLQYFFYDLEQRIFNLAYKNTSKINITIVNNIINATNPIVKICTPIRAGFIDAMVFIGHSPLTLSTRRVRLTMTDGLACGVFRLDLSRVKPPSLFIFSKSVKVPVWIIVRLVSVNGTVLTSPKILKVYLLYPSLIKYVYIPHEVNYGENITIRIAAATSINITVKIDDIKISKIINGSEGYIIIPSTRLGAGYHTMNILIVPLAQRDIYAPIVYSEALAVIAEKPKVNVIFENPAINIWNTVKMKVINKSGEPVRVRLRFGFSSIDAIVTTNASFILYGPINPLPQVYDINVTIEGIITRFTTYYRERVLIVNPLGVLAVSLMVTAIVLYSDSIDLLGLLGVRPPRMIAEKEKRRAYYTETYFEALRIHIRKSRIAQLYYSLLQRLGIPLPEPPETLREHWRRKVEPVRMGDEELRKAMFNAEKDLYGGKEKEQKDGQVT